MHFMPKHFFLVEGIDGSGKDTFAKFVFEAAKKRFDFHPDHTFSLVGQPAFRFDKTNTIQRFIEDGEVLRPYPEMVEALRENRIAHEEYLSQYNGITMCIRGLLTDMGTLKRLYGKTPSTLSQHIPIKKLIIVDVDPQIARKRILTRGIPSTWRESLKNLTFFREFFLKQAVTQPYPSLILKNNDLDSLRLTAESLIDSLITYQ